MAKKIVKKAQKSKAVKSSKYSSFRLHGNYSVQQVAILTVIDLAIGFILGFMLQPTIASLLTSYAAGL